jgi:hypothetical protein
MRGQLADYDADVGKRPLDLIAIDLAVVGLVDIEKTFVPGGDLNGLVAIVLRPFRDSG